MPSVNRWPSLCPAVRRATAKALLSCLILCRRPGSFWRIEAMIYDKEVYKQRHKIEIMFGRLKDWRRIAMRYDRCAHTFFSAICLAAIVIFYI